MATALPKMSSGAKGLSSMAEKADPKFVTMADAIREFQKQFDSQSEADFFPTGFASHDNALGRLRRGTVTFVGARPSMGKTALMLCSALKQLEAGIRVVFFTLEMPVTDMIARLVSIKTGISLFDILQRRIDDKQVRRIVGTLPELVKLEGNWSEDSALKRIGQLLNQIEPRSRSIVYVDFLGLIQILVLMHHSPTPSQPKLA